MKRSNNGSKNSSATSNPPTGGLNAPLVCSPSHFKMILQMKKILFSLLLLAAYASAQAQSEKAPAPYGGKEPEKVVEITTVLPGTTQVQTLRVAVIDGMAILEGDIVLGPIDEIQSLDRGITIDGAAFRWPNGEIPYVIAGGFTAQYVTLLNTAIEYMNGSTHMRLVPRTAEANWIEYTPSDRCSSPVGMQGGGAQIIRLMDPFDPASMGVGCYFRQIVHETAHSAGLFHEQSREDRNTFVTINFANIEAGKAFNFDQHISDATDIGAYDFASVMHYSATAFSSNGMPTITAVGGQTFGNATEYSPGDVATLNGMYTTKFCEPSTVLSATLDVDRPLHYESNTTIVSRSVYEGVTNALYDAGGSITLVDGFWAKSGTDFRAVIDGCSGSVNSLVSQEEKDWQEAAKDYLANNHTQENDSEISGKKPVLTAVDVYPNLFSNSTNIVYTLAEKQAVHIQLFDVSGALVAEPFAESTQEAGAYQMVFDAKNIAPGFYLMAIQAGATRVTKRLVCAKQ